MALLGYKGWILLPSKSNQTFFSSYQELGFRATQNDLETPGKVISDGSVIFEFSNNRSPDFQLRYICDSLDTLRVKLDEKEISYSILNQQNRLDIQTPYQFSISIFENVIHNPFNLDCISLRTIQSEFLYDKDKLPNSTLGIWGEFGVTVRNIENEEIFWEQLGFKCVEKHRGPYPWLVYSDDIHAIALHQTDALKSPMISYFAPDMFEKVKNLNNADFSIVDTQDFRYGGLPTYQLNMASNLHWYLCNI